MKGRWAAGIVPRNFTWILKDQLAVSERPGGFAPHHRRIRRQEEILWLNAQGFTRVVSLLPSNHNLHAYDELHIPAAHFALAAHGDARVVLAQLYPALWSWLRGGERVLLHQDELGEQVAGVVAGFLCWCGLLPEPPRAISVVEQLLRRQMGHAGRSMVALAAEMPPGPRHPQPLGGPAPVQDVDVAPLHGGTEDGRPGAPGGTGEVPAAPAPAAPAPAFGRPADLEPAPGPEPRDDPAPAPIADPDPLADQEPEADAKRPPVKAPAAKVPAAKASAAKAPAAKAAAPKEEPAAKTSTAKPGPKGSSTKAAPGQAAGGATKEASSGKHAGAGSTEPKAVGARARSGAKSGVAKKAAEPPGPSPRQGKAR